MVPQTKKSANSRNTKKSVNHASNVSHKGKNASSLKDQNVKPISKRYEYDDDEVYNEDELFETQRIDTNQLRNSLALADLKKGLVATIIVVIICTCIGILLYFVTHHFNQNNSQQNIPEVTKQNGIFDTHDYEIPTQDYSSPLEDPNLHISKALWSNGDGVPTYTRPDNIDPSQPLYIVIHGYGGNEVSTSSMWLPFLHNKQWVAVRAPFKLNNKTEGYAGYAWMEPPVPEDPSKQLHPDGNIFQKWVDANVPPEQMVILIGHSQGGAMVTEMMRRDPVRFAVGVSIAGFIAKSPAPGDSLLSKDNYLLSAYSTNDKIVLHKYEERLQDFFRDKVTFVEYDYPERTHPSLNDPEVENDTQNWLDSVMPKALEKWDKVLASRAKTD